MEKFIELFTELLDDAPVDVLTAETKFRDLDGWTSLVALSVIAMADEEYDVTLSGEDIRAAVTVGDLFNAVQRKK